MKNLLDGAAIEVV